MKECLDTVDLISTATSFAALTMAINGSRPWAVHVPRRYRESIASLGSTPGTLSAHHKVDTGEDGFHLSPWDFAYSLGQLPFVDGHKLRHIRDGIAV